MGMHYGNCSIIILVCFIIIGIYIIIYAGPCVEKLPHKDTSFTSQQDGMHHAISSQAEGVWVRIIPSVLPRRVTVVPMLSVGETSDLLF